MSELHAGSPAAIFCSVNRAQMLHESVLCVVRQTVPCRILVSVPSAQDVSPETASLPNTQVLIGARGSCAQRNAALKAIDTRPEAVFFFDDDVELDPSYIAEVLAVYREHPEVSMVNGTNLASGKYAPGTLDRPTAVRLIEEQRQAGLEDGSPVPLRASIGNRMSFRGDLLGKVAFDERLVLYGYLEDYDLSLACKRYGPIVQAPRALGVHIEVTGGRMGEHKRGYSEVVNPMYIWSKGTGAGLGRSLLGGLKRTLNNARRALKGDRERFLGNLKGWTSLLTGRPKPERILTIK